jgi:hypothetical protein
MRKHHRELVRKLESLGYRITNIETQTRGNHFRFTAHLADRSITYTTATSPSDHRSHLNCIADIRRQLRSPAHEHH